MRLSSSRYESIAHTQQAVLAKIAQGTPLSQLLNEVCVGIEELIGDEKLYASILLLKENQLYHGAAPSISQDFRNAIDGVEIGIGVGSCGTAAKANESVIVDNINTHPYWANYKELALSAGLQACWSTPINASDGSILGTFAVYYVTPKKPSKSMLDTIAEFNYLSAIAIELNSLLSTRQRLNQALDISLKRFKAFTNVMPDLGLVLDEYGNYVEVYGAENMLLYKKREELLGRNLLDILPKENALKVKATIDKAIAENKIQIIEYELEVQAGPVVFEGRVAPIDGFDSEKPNLRHVIWMARNITSRKQAELEIQRLALYDQLTGLPNRRLLGDRLKQDLQHIKRAHQLGVVLFIDLDDFKRINDSLGHSSGDQLLKNVSERLSMNMRGTDTIARIGGDEFVILLSSHFSSESDANREAVSIAEKLLESLKEPFKLGDSWYKIFCSIGISFIHSVDTIDEVLKRADSAMYRSKKLGGKGFQIFDPEMQSRLDNQLALEADIIRAIGNNEFQAYYQPKVDFYGSVIGAETLIRWNHPEKGLISPADFIPVAERFGLIFELQNIVIRQSCEFLQSIRESGLVAEHFCIAINVSPVHFKVKDMYLQFANSIKNYGLESKNIIVEITEGLLLESREATLNNIKSLRELGFRFSIDDFGVGYSSLSYLQAFHLDELKIDKKFIDDLPTSKGSQAIVKAIVGMSNAFEFEVIAEGVETQEQVDILKTYNIKAMQGYLYSKPCAQEAFLEWLKQNKTINV